MKLLCFLCALVGFASGCTHPGHRSKSVAVAPALLLPVRPLPAATPSAPSFPAEYEEYYVGILPGDDSTFAYQPGTLRVQTRPERLRYQAHPGPTATPRDPNFHPEPTSLEVSALLGRSQRAMAKLSEQNESLRSRVAELSKTPPAADPLAVAATNPPTPPAPDLASLRQPAPMPPPAAAPTPPAPAALSLAEPGELNVIQPNADYAIELDPRFFEDANTSSNNPFAQRYQPHVALRDVALDVSAAIPGPNPSAILNDRTVSIGDTFEGLQVYRIDADRVVLRKDTFLLLCPVSDRTLNLRLP